MKTFLIIYLTIGIVLVILWDIFTMHWQKKYKKVTKDWVFWSNVFEIIFLWPINIGMKIYLTYMVFTGKVDGEIIVDESTDNYEDRE